jgi:hypothetical protein
MWLLFARKVVNLMPMKIKPCALCQIESTTLYRVQIETGKTWIFVCVTCLAKAKLSAKYRYGGTWKGSRH